MRIKNTLVIAFFSIVIGGCSSVTKNNFTHTNDNYVPLTEFQSTNSIYLKIINDPDVKNMKENEKSNLDKFLKSSILGSKKIKYASEKKKRTSVSRLRNVLNYHVGKRNK